MAIVCQDWTRCTPSEIEPLIACEADIWRSELSWDVRPSWRVIEPARAAGALPGFVARDSRNQICGWTWFVVADGCLQIGAVVGREPTVVDSLVDAVMASRQAKEAISAICSVRGYDASVTRALSRHGFDVAVYGYQIAPLIPELLQRMEPVESEPVPRPWTIQDREPAASLFQSAYSMTTSVRPFAPGGSRSEWRRYLATLLQTDGCGEFHSDASFVVDDDAASGLIGAVICTAIGSGTAHLAQVAVAPDWRGRGLGRRLVLRAMASFANAGLSRMSLLVARDNSAAVRLYRDLGFVESMPFVVASRLQPRRLTSLALATCGVSTRR